MGDQYLRGDTGHNMQAFICLTAPVAAASAAPQFLAGHGVALGHGVGLGHAVAHPVAHAVAHPVVAHAAPVVHAVAHPVAHAVGYANPDLAEVSPYTYNYGVADEYTGAAFSQSESNDGTGVVDGSYSVNLPDGRIQTVNYHANDIDGYVADVSYNGVAAVAPVAHAVAHPVVAHAAPIVRTVAAPVVHSGLVGHGVFGHGLVGHGVVGHGLVG